MNTRRRSRLEIGSLSAVLALATSFAIGLSSMPAGAEIPPEETFPALGAPDDPKVEVRWNRFYDVAGLHRILEQLHDAYPDLTELVELGQSYEGRRILALEVTAKKVGDPKTKPAMYIDGNIHGNEVQAGETVAYTAWYLLESYGKIERITRLLDERAFYLVPTINPDGRDHWFHSPANPHYYRGGVVPVDNDGDGRFDEDGPDDLDGDGYITQMRVKDPWGTHVLDPEYPDYLVERVARDRRGDYRMLGWEGSDEDGDGEINEDGPGGFDPNRNWPWTWQPEGVQYGAHDYPFSLPNTRAVGNYVLSKPNIAAIQSYHNSGGMILRGPGQEADRIDPDDDRIHQFIAERGEEMLPHYDSMVLWTDLYPVWGGEFNWFYGSLGVISLTNELWTSDNLYRRELADGQEGRRERAAFLRYVLQNQGIQPWTEVDHPDYGKVEVGGTTKEWGRVPPSFMIEEELHRNTAFTLFHAETMPRIEIAEVETSAVGGGLYRVRVGIDNHGIIPTRIAHDVNNGITPRNAVTLQGRGIQVVGAGTVSDPLRNQVQWQKIRPERLLLETIGGHNRTWVEFLVSGTGQGTVRVEAQRGGVDQRTVSLP